jgi:hypothetical protein
MIFAGFCIVLAVAILAGVRHEPHVRAWAMNPRTPARVAAAITSGVAAVWQAAYMAVGVSLGGVGLAFLIATAGNVA